MEKARKSKFKHSQKMYIYKSIKVVPLYLYWRELACKKEEAHKHGQPKSPANNNEKKTAHSLKKANS